VTVLLLGVLLALGACGPAVVASARAPERADGGSAVPAFAFADDTFAFRNEVRSLHPDVPDLYANYCFVLARSLRQFFVTARFDPRAPRLDHQGYVERVRAIVARPPWAPALPPAERVVVPGYANLRELSAGEEAAVKEAMGGRFWTLVHWTNWRVTFPVTGEHQQRVAAELADELAAGRLAQLLVTNWPKPELNHTVVAYAVRETPARLDFTVWDPNDPDLPGVVTFDAGARRFLATRLFGTQPGPIRVFRMGYSRWL
jgi:hypothetical protein